MPACTHNLQLVMLAAAAGGCRRVATDPSQDTVTAMIGLALDSEAIQTLDPRR